MSAQILCAGPGKLEIRVSGHSLLWGLGCVASLAFICWGEVLWGLLLVAFTGFMAWKDRGTQASLDRDGARVRVIRQGVMGGPWGAFFREVPLSAVREIRVTQSASEGVDHFGLEAVLNSGETLELCQAELSLKQLRDWEARLREGFGTTIPVEVRG